MPFHFEVIEKRNAANLKATPEGGHVSYLYTMEGRKPVILIGKGHDAQAVAQVKDARHYEGLITIKKGGALSAGELTVSGCKANRAEFEQALARFTKKKVTFVA